ncbi:MAG TPA: hypothetical protein VGL13_04190, partial [Polyangiaceae bacterium]
MTLTGCLSNSYVVQHDELARLATVDPASRGASIRAVQQIGGDDDPPGGAAVDPVPPTPVHTVFIETVVVEPQGGPHRDREHHGSTTHTSHSEKGSPSKKGNGDSADAVVIAAAVVAGAGMTLALAGSEGARYDGWLAVPSEEMMHLELPDGLERDVPLSALTPYDVASADRAILYEGKDGRYLRLGRAPLDRAGFTMGTAFHMG